MPNKAAAGAGTIRKKTVTRNGKQYSFWEARITTGKDGRGRQIQRSFSGKTQKEVREKMQAAAVEITDGAYIAPAKMNVYRHLMLSMHNNFYYLVPENYSQHKCLTWCLYSFSVLHN